MIPDIVDALKTVLAGMLGVRARADHERESASLNPLYVVIVGVVVVVLFVLTLVAIASLVAG